MKRVVALLLWCSLGFAANATTVIPPSFDTLVRESELIFRGRVIAMKSAWTGVGPTSRIATWVTFAVERTLRGTVDDTLTLEFIGGTVGAKRLEAAGWPTFEVGDRGVFFVENRNGRMCPLLALRHGRYRIVGDGAAAEERVARDDHTPLRAAAEVSAALAESNQPRRAAMESALTLAAFEAQIVTRSAEFPVSEKAAP